MRRELPAVAVSAILARAARVISTNRKAFLIGIAGLCVGDPATAFAQSSYTFQAPTGPGGTWNVYRFESGGLSFKGANNAANATVDPITGLVPGRLVSINGAFENTTMWNMSGRGDTWIGLTD